MMHLQTSAPGSKDLQGLLTIQFGNSHWLKPALQCGISADISPVYILGSSPDHANMATRERGLEHICRIHRRSQRRARPDEVVQLIDKENDIFVFTDSFDEGSEPLFILPAKASPGNKIDMAERENMYIEKRRRHLTRCYKLCQSFNNRGLTDASFADEYWIIFRLSKQCCNNAFDRRITTEDRLAAL